jgi:hypothetical protein
MAMRTATPWWASLAFGIGLLFFALGERLFAHSVAVRFALTGLGLLLMVGVSAVRVWAMQASHGARRNVERTLVISHAGTLGALVLYLISTDWGMAKLALGDAAAAHFHGAITVLYLAALVASLVPLIMVELSLGVALRTAFDVSRGSGDDAGVEYFRVREIGWSGLSVGLALAFLMVTCQVADQRNAQIDVSYFKTSSPGESTQKILTNTTDPVRALLFFPDANQVKDQVKGYFDALASATGKLSVEMHDRLADAELAGKYKVTKDGTVVLLRGTGDKEKSQTLDVDTDIAKARTPQSKLRNLDREVNTLLLKLLREKHKAYLMIGHGEASDADSMTPEAKARAGERSMTVFRRRLADLNYEVKNLGLLDLARDVPDDATVVIAMAPSAPLQLGEWAALVRYLDRGGRLLLALEPKGSVDLGPLEGKFALRMMAGELTDEEKFLPMRRVLRDRRMALTNQFSAHASTTALSRGSADRPLVLNGAGALEDLPYTGPPADAPKKTITIRSMESSFLDLNDNFSFDAATEKKQRYNVAAAVEGPKLADKEGYRALVFADVDLFADVIARDPLGRPVAIMWSDATGSLLDDSVKWLGGDEQIVGDVVSEDDKPIQHTKNEDVVWFMLMIIGAPIIVLTLGLIGTWARRRRSSKTEVTK